MKTVIDAGVGNLGGDRKYKGALLTYQSKKIWAVRAKWIDDNKKADLNFRHSQN